MDEKQTSSDQNLEPQQQQVTQPATQNPAISSPDLLQNTTIVDGQSINQTMPVSGVQIEHMSGQKPSKWRYFFIVLGILQALCIAIFFLIINTWVSPKTYAGVSGTEFMEVILFATIIFAAQVPVVVVVVLINLIGLPIYMRKHMPQGKGLVFSILSLVISVILVLYGAYSVYHLRVALPKHVDELSEQSRQKSEAGQQQFASDNSKPEITKEDAINLLKTCKLKGFYYTNQTSKDDGNWGELSSTGVVLTKIDGQPYRISIADKLVPELVPIAREAQKTCGAPQFWHDGNYE